jgi:hypothetical protein
VYNLNYTAATLGVQSCREITSGGTRTIKVANALVDHLPPSSVEMPAALSPPRPSLNSPY